MRRGTYVPLVVMNPRDEGRAKALAKSLKCRSLVSENCPDDMVRLVGFQVGAPYLKAVSTTEKHLPGWRIAVV